MSELPALNHCHAEGHPTSEGLSHELQALAVLFDDDAEMWTRGEDDDPVEFGISVNRESASFLDEEVFEEVCELAEASDQVFESVRKLAEADVIGEATICIDVQLDAGIEADELVNLEGMQ